MPPKQQTKPSTGGNTTTTTAHPPTPATTSTLQPTTTNNATQSGKKSVQEVVEVMPHFSQRLEDAMKSQLNHVIDGIESDPLYSGDFDPIDYINAKFPTEDSVQNGAVQFYLTQTKQKIATLQAQIRQEIRAQASNHLTIANANQANNNTSSSTTTTPNTTSTTTTPSATQQQQGRELLDIVQSTNKEVASLFDQIKTIKQTAAPSEQLVAQICVDISALDLAKRHLQRTSSGLRYLHMLISTTTRLAEAVHSTDYKTCVTLIDSVDGLLAFFDPYKHLEKIKIVNNQIRQLKRKICEEANILIRKTVILNIPAHTVESFPPQSDIALKYRDALQVIKLVDPKLELDIVSTWCEAVLSPYTHIFTKNQDSIGLQYVERRLAWFRRELKRCLPIYDHIFPHGYNIWSNLTQQFCTITKDHLKGYLQVFSRVSYYEIINTSGIGHTTYIHDDTGKLLQIKQGRKRSTMPAQHQPGEVPLHPLHIYDEAVLQRERAAHDNQGTKRSLFGSLANWAEQYTQELKSPTAASSNNNNNNNGEASLSLDDFDNDVAIPQQMSNQVDSDPVLGKVSISNERNIPLLVNALSKCLVFEKEMITKVKTLDTEHGAQRQYQRYAQPFIDMYDKSNGNQPNSNNNNNTVTLVQPPTSNNQQSSSPNKASSSNNTTTPPLPPIAIELTSIFEPYMFNLVIVERHSLLNLINGSLQSEHWVPTTLHQKPRYPSCDQLLFYIKRSIDNISKICNTNVLMLLFMEYVTSLRHYVNILTITSDLPYLKSIPTPYVQRCGITLVSNPSGSTISGLFANPNNSPVGNSNGNDMGQSTSNNNNNNPNANNNNPSATSSSNTTSGQTGNNNGTTTTTSRTTAILNSFNYSNPGQPYISSTSHSSNPGQQPQHLGTVSTLEQFVRLGICFNTCEHISDILPSFISKLKEKLDDSTPLPPSQQDELDIGEYAEQSLQYIKQNIYIFSAHRLFQELSMLPHVSWSPGSAANNPLAATSSNPSGKPIQLAQTSKHDLLFGTGGNNNNNGDVNVYALSTSKYIKFFTAYSQILFSPAYYSAYVKYLAQRLFPDILACILLCRSISQTGAQQMVIDIYTVTFAIHNIYNYQLDIHVHKAVDDGSGIKPGMSEKPNLANGNGGGDEILTASTSILSPSLLQQQNKDKSSGDSPSQPTSIILRYPLVDIPANTNVATIRIFLRFVKKEIALLESYTKVISGSSPNNITNTISIYLGDECTDETVLSLFNVIGVPLIDQNTLLNKYHDLGVAAKQREEQERLIQEQEYSSAQGKSYTSPIKGQ